MPVDWDHIHKEWLLGYSIEYEPNEIVEAFNLIERHFGETWLNSKFQYHRGLAVVIPLVDLGKILKEIEKTPSSKRIIQKLKEDQSDMREVARLGTYFLRCGLQVEFEPKLQVKGHQKRPDLRVKYNEKWVFIEVTRPLLSNHQRKINYSYE